MATSSSSSSDARGKKEIYTYEAPWTCYAMGWCRRPDGRFRMAVGSYKEEYSNQVQIIQLQRDEAGNGVFRHQCEFEHPYPATKVMWAPAKHHIGGQSDLLATTGDYLRLWSTTTDGSAATGGEINKVEMKALLNNNKHTEYCAPLTCFDWNDTDPSILGTCSIDTTCTIWDVNKLQPKTQLIAHDKVIG